MSVVPPSCLFHLLTWPSIQIFLVRGLLQAAPSTTCHGTSQSSIALPPLPSPILIAIAPRSTPRDRLNGTSSRYGDLDTLHISVGYQVCVPRISSLSVCSIVCRVLTCARASPVSKLQFAVRAHPCICVCMRSTSPLPDTLTTLANAVHTTKHMHASIFYSLLSLSLSHTHTLLRLGRSPEQIRNCVDPDEPQHSDFFNCRQVGQHEWGEDE